MVTIGGTRPIGGEAVGQRQQGVVVGVGAPRSGSPVVEVLSGLSSVLRVCRIRLVSFLLLFIVIGIVFVVVFIFITGIVSSEVHTGPIWEGPDFGAVVEIVSKS